MTMTEIGIALALMRDDRATIASIAADFERYYRARVTPAELATPHRRMVERALLEPHPTEPERCSVSRRGERLAYAAFGGLVRFIDEGQHRFEVSLIWSLATRRAPDENC